MKLKIISGNNYHQLEPEVNEFMSTVKVVQVEVREVYDIQTDSGFVTYHVFYEDKPTKQQIYTRLNRPRK